MPIAISVPSACFPTSPAWAMVRSSSWRILSWPAAPGVAVMGARFSLERKKRFPFPPAPPNTARYSWPCSERSTTISPCSFTTVPRGTFVEQTSTKVSFTVETCTKLSEMTVTSNSWTHRNTSGDAVLAVTVLVAPRLTVFSPVNRKQLRQRLDKLVR